MVSVLLAGGLVMAVYVGVNIGGSSTGVAFGPATGAGVVSKRQAAGLMASFALLGGLLVGPNVVETLGEGFVPEEHFTLAASIAVLLFIGSSLLVSNIMRVSASTSETAVGAVVGMGAALGVLNFATVGIVVTWWFVATMLAFWTSAVLGRYFYERIHAVFAAETERERRLLQGVAVAVGCYMAFSAGASNVANAVAPLVGAGQLGMIPGVLLAGVSIGAGAFLLGGRTMETVGNEITPLTLEASVVVEVLAATIITGLSWLGIPASLAITLQACVMGFGWGRTTREIPLDEVLGVREGSGLTTISDDRLGLYNVNTVKRIVSMWLFTPTAAGLLAFVTFEAAGWLGLLGA